MIPSLGTNAPADTLPASAASARLGACEPNDAVDELAQLCRITMLPTRMSSQWISQVSSFGVGIAGGG
jgi:hypothetical protein